MATLFVSFSYLKKNLSNKINFYFELKKTTVNIKKLPLESTNHLERNCHQIKALSIKTYTRILRPEKLFPAK